ncbi:hypothetical protein NL497_28775, partial [Klebsiella pneumoniae]|nr:hypothetical protein [Klebsiella pneumoniae]
FASLRFVTKYLVALASTSFFASYCSRQYKRNAVVSMHAADSRHAFSDFAGFASLIDNSVRNNWRLAFVTENACFARASKTTAAA